MDTKDLIGGNNVTLDVVKSSPTKKAMFLSGGVMRTFPDGKTKPSMLVEMDGKQISYTPNKTSLKNIALVFGYESNNWIGKYVSFECGIVNGKEAIIARPVQQVVSAFAGVVQ